MNAELVDDQQAMAAALTAVSAWLEALAKKSARASRSFAIQVPPGTALARVTEVFGLSTFELHTLVLLASVELHPRIVRLLAEVDEFNRDYPTFGLALSLFPEPEWRALLPDAPLRGARLVELGDGEVLTQRPLHISERVLHALLGHDEGLDRRLARRLIAVGTGAGASASAATPTHAEASASLAAGLRDARPTMLLTVDPEVGLVVAAQAADAAARRLWTLDARLIPAEAAERDELATLWTREAKLAPVALALTIPATVDVDRDHRVADFCRRLGGPWLTISAEAPELAGALRLELAPVAYANRVATWRAAVERRLGARELASFGERGEAMLGRLAGQFSIDAAAVELVIAQANPSPGDAVERVEAKLWDACRVHARPKLAELAQRVEVRASFDQLVLPPSQRAMLDALISQVRQRARVHYGWGFDELGPRGAGIAAIFAGPSGTGKTLTAEIIANELDLDLFRIDLSAVVSKYIGETEENLRKVFDAAEAGGAVLLFDEADALFGKRTEVRDSHDRHANIEVSYLLQRMEAYRGLAILTTNMRKAIDDAFLRRVQFIIDFPFPSNEQREQIWARIFPGKAPLGDLDYAKLARLSIAGGNIRSIARNAAYLAADGGGEVQMVHLLEAAKIEYAKLSRSLPPADIRGWLDGGSP